MKCSYVIWFFIAFVVLTICIAVNEYKINKIIREENGKVNEISELKDVIEKLKVHILEQENKFEEIIKIQINKNKLDAKEKRKLNDGITPENVFIQAIIISVVCCSFAFNIMFMIVGIELRDCICFVSCSVIHFNINDKNISNIFIINRRNLFSFNCDIHCSI